jgi:hypothetical protein
MDTDRILKWVLGLMICSVILIGVRLVYEVEEILEFEKNHESYDFHTSIYHKTADIHRIVKEENHVNPYYTWYDLTKTITDSKRKIYGYGPLVNASDVRLRVFVLCNQHGREMVTGEICYTLIRLLQLGIRDAFFTSFLRDLHSQNVGFWIVPVANPWARRQVERNESMACRRTNSNGVDLNRNYPTRIERHTDGDEEEYQGVTPFSEYESKAVSQFLDFSDAHILINVHSGGEDILLPYDGRIDIPPHYSVMVEIARRVRDLVNCKECRIGMASSLYGTNGDATLGTLGDYATDTGTVDLSYTLEVYSNTTIENVIDMAGLECFRYFNPREGKALMEVQRRWVHFILGVCDEVLSIIETKEEKK